VLHRSLEPPVATGRVFNRRQQFGPGTWQTPATDGGGK